MSARLLIGALLVAIAAPMFGGAAENPPPKRSWGPEQATGAPDTPRAGDQPTAWAARRPEDGIQWLQVEYEKAVGIAEVRIRESHCPGGVSQVVARLEGGREVTLWAGRDPTREAPRDLVVKVRGKIVSKSVRIYIDTERTQGWEEIDAVELVGKDGTRQWAVRASASTTFARPHGPEPPPPPEPPPWPPEPPPPPPRPPRRVPVLPPQVPQEAHVKRGYGPEQATGAPDTPRAGDISTAWAARSSNGGIQWLQLEYDRAVNIAEVRVRETNAPGAVRRVTALADGGKEVELWKGLDPTAVAPGDLVVKVDGGVASRVVKVYIDTNAKDGWEEIDAVALVGKDGTHQWASRATASSTYARPARAGDQPALVPAPTRLPPRVVEMSPPPHAIGVDPGLKAIMVSFGRPMVTESASAWMLLRPHGLFPPIPIGAKPRFDNTGRTCILPVSLVKGTVYAVGINSAAQAGFTDREGTPALPFAWAFATGGYRAEELPPRVVRTSPQQGALNVDPDLKTLSITFDRPMRRETWSLGPVPGRGEYPLSFSRNPRFDQRGLTCIVPLSLKPDTVYALSINPGNGTGFKSRAGAPALPFPLAFKTRK